ncbi:MAG: hypothetical protein NTNFB02_28670 [Nitrospira sp.]
MGKCRSITKIRLVAKAIRNGVNGRMQAQRVWEGELGLGAGSVPASVISFSIGRTCGVANAFHVLD